VRSPFVFETLLCENDEKIEIAIEEATLSQWAQAVNSFQFRNISGFGLFAPKQASQLQRTSEGENKDGSGSAAS